MKTCLNVALAVVAICVVQAHAGQPTFQGLGILPGKTGPALRWSTANAIAADVTVVVGSSGYEAFRWTPSGGLLAMGDLAGGLLNSRACGVSSDGAVVVGTGKTDSPDKNLYNHNQAFRWTASGGFEDLGDLPNGSPTSEAYGVSADGCVVVGYAHGAVAWRAFRWTQQTGMQDLGPLPGGYHSWARGVSNDGSVVVGYGTSPNASSGGVLAYHEAFLWTASAGMTPLGDLPGGYFGSEAYGVSADGSVVVGRSEYDDYPRAFRWTQAGGMQSLGMLEGMAQSSATAVSADGSVIVGSCSHPMHDTLSFIWDQAHGMRNLVEVLENDCGLDLTGWSSLMVGGISDDGLTLVGAGRNSSGDTEAWIATIPEPATLSLLALGGLALLRRKRASEGQR